MGLIEPLADVQFRLGHTTALGIEAVLRYIYKSWGDSHCTGIQPIEGTLNLMPPCRWRFILDNQLPVLKESNVPVGIQVVLAAILAIVEEDRQRGDAGAVRKIQQHALVTTLDLVLGEHCGHPWRAGWLRAPWTSQSIRGRRQ